MSETSLMKVGAVGVDSGQVMLLDPCYEGKIGNVTPTDFAQGISIAKHRDNDVAIGVIAATGIGDGVFPVVAELVDGKLNGLLVDFGNEHLEDGVLAFRCIAREKSAPVMHDDPDREAELLEQREQARVGEDRYKAERDAALNLLRWLIGDLIPTRGE